MELLKGNDVTDFGYTKYGEFVIWKDKEPLFVTRDILIKIVKSVDMLTKKKRTRTWIVDKY